MSTDMQQYSIQNQAEAIALYAASHGLTIVQTYEDHGKSGLRVEGRNALQNLIADVQSGRANFGTILVYDVSRWGRFQDADESAYYEFVCKEAGVSIQYCAEQFANDGSVTATIIKNIKRAMAGEYSRELSVKVHAGQSRLAAMGFAVGSSGGYALRRTLVDQFGVQKTVLRPGEWKSIKTDRVILAPGPIKEVRTVQRVYDLFIDEKKSITEITQLLNAEGTYRTADKPWTLKTIQTLLSNEKYMGTSVYNRTSRKLHINWQRNPKAEWITKNGAFAPIISPERFEQARRRLPRSRFEKKYSENEMLDYLTAIWCCRGRLSGNIINSFPNSPGLRTYVERFGGLLDAFHRIGFGGSRFATRARLKKVRVKITEEIIENISKVGRVEMAKTDLKLFINGEFSAMVAVGRESPTASKRTQYQWKFSYQTQQKPDFLIVARVDTESLSVRDYFILPFIFLPSGSWVTVSGGNYARFESYRSATLTPFYELCAREPLCPASR
jgi:DNA invertase Pin-like site-specific DNA recombinase